MNGPGFEELLRQARASFASAAPVSFPLPADFEERFRARSNFVLQSEAALDLGGAANGSALCVTRAAGAHARGSVLLAGPEAAASPSGAPFAFYASVAGEGVSDEILYMIAQNARKYLLVRGVMVKGSGSEIWLRVSRKALAGGFSFAMLGEVFVRRVRTAFPEAASVGVVIASGPSAAASGLLALASCWQEESEKLKDAVWKSRGFNFRDCGVIGHCGQCGDRKICANVRKIEREVHKKHIDIREVQ